MLKGKRKKGFTLVELMVVIAIIAVLLLIAVPKLTEATKGSKVRTFEANFRTAMSAVNAAYADSGLDVTQIANNPNVKDLVITNTPMNGKPAGSTYSVEAGTGKLTAKLTIDSEAYDLTFDPTTGIVTANAAGTLAALKSFK